MLELIEPYAGRTLGGMKGVGCLHASTTNACSLAPAEAQAGDTLKALRSCPMRKQAPFPLSPHPPSAVTYRYSLPQSLSGKLAMHEPLLCYCVFKAESYRTAPYMS